MEDTAPGNPYVRVIHSISQLQAMTRCPWINPSHDAIIRSPQRDYPMVCLYPSQILWALSTYNTPPPTTPYNGCPATPGTHLRSSLGTLLHAMAPASTKYLRHTSSIPLVVRMTLAPAGTSQVEQQHRPGENRGAGATERYGNLMTVHVMQ